MEHKNKKPRNPNKVCNIAAVDIHGSTATSNITMILPGWN